MLTMCKAETITFYKMCQLVTIVQMFPVIVQISAVFIEIPLPLNVTTEQHAQFRCIHPTADTIAWRVNGTSIRNFPDLIAAVVSESNGTLASNLTIEAHLEYNETQLDCIALFFDSDLTVATELSPTVTLRIQGPLQEVANLGIDINLNELKLLWDPPFSLDITNVDPDIIYCVEVTNATCGNQTTLFSNCTIKETLLNLSGYSRYNVYELTVTPRNNVEGAKNGTPLIARVEFMKYQVTHLNVCFEDVLFAAHVQLTMIEIIVSGAFFKTRPTSYSLLLVSNDGFDEETLILKATIDDATGNSVVLGVQPLLRRRRWNYTVIAYECNQHPLTSTAELSTHDVQNILIYSPDSGQIQVSGILVQDANTVGILIIVYPLDHVNLNVYYFEALKTTMTNIITTTVTGLSAGQYGVSVFVLEDSGLPFNRSASTPKRIIVQNGKHLVEPDIIIEYKVSPASTNGHGVCVDCLFLDRSTEYCVVVIHEKVLCFGVSQCEMNLTNIATSFKIPRSGDKGHRCVQINVTNLQVGVIGGRQVPHIVTATDSTCAPSCTDNRSLAIGVVLVLAGFFIIILGLTLILTMRYCHAKRISSRSLSRMPVPETQESHYQPLPLRGIKNSIRTTQTDINSELPTYDEVAQSDFQNAYLMEVTNTNERTDSQTTAHFTIKNLTKYLLPVADKWKELGEILSITENILDEIFTNNDTHEGCLREMLNYYLVRSDLVHDWEEISTALIKLGEETLANEINHMLSASDANHDSEPVEVVTAVEVSTYTGGHEPHNELAIPIPHVMANEETEGHRTSGVTMVVGISMPDSGFHAPKQVLASNSNDIELTHPIPETTQPADPTKSLCIHLQRDNQRELDQESLIESDVSHDSSSHDSSSHVHVMHLAGSAYPSENYESRKHKSRQLVRNSAGHSYEYALSSSIAAPSHVYSGDEEWHVQNSFLCQPYGTQPVQLECTNGQSDMPCTAESHDSKVKEDLPIEPWPCTHCEAENIGSSILPVEHDLSVTQSLNSVQRLSQHSISSSECSPVEFADT